MTYKRLREAVLKSRSKRFYSGNQPYDDCPEWFELMFVISRA